MTSFLSGCVEEQVGFYILCEDYTPKSMVSEGFLFHCPIPLSWGGDRESIRGFSHPAQEMPDEPVENV
jgi:hypothetical protein